MCRGNASQRDRPQWCTVSCLRRCYIGGEPCLDLTIDMLAEFLHMTRRQIYEMTSTRGQSAPNPLPVLRVNGNIRFRKNDIEQWLATLAGKKAA